MGDSEDERDRERDEYMSHYERQREVMRNVSASEAGTGVERESP